MFMNKNPYQAVWDKFLPVIAMKLRSVIKNSDSEYIPMNQLDFEKVSQHKKSNYQFYVELNEGRLMKSKSAKAVAVDFARALREYPPVYEMIKSGVFIFSLNSKFVLSLGHQPKIAAPEKNDGEVLVTVS